MCNNYKLFLKIEDKKINMTIKVANGKKMAVDEREMSK